MSPKTSSLQGAKEFLTFVDASPSPFHAVQSVKERLENAGFLPIKERDSWAEIVEPGGKYYMTRNGSSVIAFAVGHLWSPGNSIAMIGAHTDSPCLRIKPVSKRQAEGFMHVGVETYGGGIWHTWFDRDLGVAGRVMAKTGDGTFVQKLVKIDKPILRIPTLAIHLERQETFAFNKETQLYPIAGLVAAELNRQGKGSSAAEGKGENSGSEEDREASQKQRFDPLQAISSRHHPYVLELIAKEAGVKPQEIEDFELVLFDTQKASIGGINDEFILSARLDNLMMTFCGLRGLLESLSSPSTLKDDSTIRLFASFDHEEIGSQSAQGAHSNLLPAVLKRLTALPSPPELTNQGSKKQASGNSIPIEVDPNNTYFEQTLSTSFLISADMAHSVHPTYPAKYESSHRPEINQGTVIKINANARYATNSPGIVLLQEVARRAKKSSSNLHTTSDSGVPLQLFVVRNDSSCGSTIGPMLAASLGARTLDLGNAQLSMHSIREMGGTHDVENATNLFASFYKHYEELEKKILIDNVDDSS